MPKDYRATLKGIVNADPINNHLPRLEAGDRYRVILGRYYCTDSKKDKGTIVAVDVVVKETNAERSWAWLPEAGGWHGVYEQDRAKQFLEAVQGCLGGEEDLDQISDALIAEEQFGRGVELEVTVTPKMENGRQMVNKKGKPLFDLTWFPVEQTEEDIAANRAVLDESKMCLPREDRKAAAPAARSSAPAQRPAAGFGRGATPAAETAAPPPAVTGAKSIASRFGKRP